jgi:hypothetical protein
MLYSACLYLLLCFVVWITNENRTQAIRDANGHFEDSVDAYMLFVYLVPLAYLPFTHWREASKVAKYFNDWKTFQVRVAVLLNTGVCLKKQVIIWLDVAICGILSRPHSNDVRSQNIPFYKCCCH